MQLMLTILVDVFPSGGFYEKNHFNRRRYLTGHVTPNLALLPSLKKAGYEIRYIGSYQGIERKLIEGAGIP